MSDDAYHTGPPPIGSRWSNTQETRIVLHTYGTHAHAYTVQYEVWRGFPELRRCGSASCNGTAWRVWVANARRFAEPADGGGDVGNQEPRTPSAGSTSGSMERRPTVAPHDSNVVSDESKSLVRRAYERDRLVHLAKEQQGKKDRGR